MRKPIDVKTINDWLYRQFFVMEKTEYRKYDPFNFWCSKTHGNIILIPEEFNKRIKWTVKKFGVYYEYWRPHYDKILKEKVFWKRIKLGDFE